MLVSREFDTVFAGVLGLLIGSFMNVVIYRTPVMMYRDWLADAVANLMPSKDAPSLWSLAFGPKVAPPRGWKQLLTRRLQSSKRSLLSTWPVPRRAAEPVGTRSAGTRTSPC